MINDLRFSGLASGMDTESIIKKLMGAERIPLNKTFQQKQRLEWQRDAYREVNAQIMDLRSSMEKLRLQSTFQQSMVSSSDSTKLDVSKVGSPSFDSYTVSDVTFAEPAQPASVKFTTNSTLADQDAVVGENFSFQVNSKLIEVKATDTIKAVLDKINAVSSETGVKASYFADDKSITFVTAEMNENATVTISGTSNAANVLGITDGTITGQDTAAKVIGDSLADTNTQFLAAAATNLTLNLSVDGFNYGDIDLNTVETKNYTAAGSGEATGQPNFDDLAKDLQADINAAIADTSKHVTVVNNGGKLEITSPSKGSLSNITIGTSAAGTTDAAAKLGLTGKSDAGENGTNTFGSNAVAGRDIVSGSATINGTVLQIKSSSFTYDGIQFNLKAEFTDPVIVTKASDSEAIFENIKSFVDKYNEIIASLNDKLTEKKYRDYHPLLSEQKENMKEKEIELWDEKAKSGLLRSDSLISKTITDLRTSLATAVSGLTAGAPDTLREIGITTSSNYKDNGKLNLDETKLKGMLSTNLDDIQSLFTKSYDTGDTKDTTATNKTKHDNSGIAWRIYDQLNASLSRLVEKAGANAGGYDNSFIGKSIEEIDGKIADWEDRLVRVQDRYWRQFTAMEKAIQQANAQSGWLTQQLGGGM
jgi:flagellar hook-associated protein 2